MEGDALADIEHFCQWLQKRQSSATQATNLQAIEGTEANAGEDAEATNLQAIESTEAFAGEVTEAANLQAIQSTEANAGEGAMPAKDTEAANLQAVQSTEANAGEGREAADKPEIETAGKREIHDTEANATDVAVAGAAGKQAFEGQVAELQKKMGSNRPGEEPFSPGVKLPDYAALPEAADLEKLAEVATLQAELGEREIAAGSVLSEAEIADYLRRAAAPTGQGSASAAESKEKDKKERVSAKAKAKVKADEGP
eukprot:s4665_g7.t1